MDNIIYKNNNGPSTSLGDAASKTAEWVRNVEVEFATLTACS